VLQAHDERRAPSISPTPVAGTNVICGDNRFYYPLAPISTKSTARLRHREQTRRFCQSGTVVSAPYRAASSPGSGSTRWPQALHQTTKRAPAVAVLPSVAGGPADFIAAVLRNAVIANPRIEWVAAPRSDRRKIDTSIPPSSSIVSSAGGFPIRENAGWLVHFCDPGLQSRRRRKHRVGTFVNRNPRSGPCALTYQTKKPPL
jgi:hypothetical protein